MECTRYVRVRGIGDTMFVPRWRVIEIIDIIRVTVFEIRNLAEAIGATGVVTGSDRSFTCMFVSSGPVIAGCSVPCSTHSVVLEFPDCTRYLLTVKLSLVQVPRSAEIKGQPTVGLIHKLAREKTERVEKHRTSLGFHRGSTTEITE
jgi:hypothetical protein